MEQSSYPQECGAILRIEGQTVRCIRMPGPCLLDDHLGPMRVQLGRVQLVRWGKEAELHEKEFGPGQYPVIKTG